MTKLSLTLAWTETSAFVRREASLLAPVALAFAGLPSILFDVTRPLPAEAAANGVGAWGLVAVLTMLLSAIGTLAITALALRPGMSVREALALAARRLLPVLAGAALIGVAMFLLALPPVMVAVLAGGSANPQSLTATTVLILSVMLLVSAVRMLPLSAVAVQERVGPVALLKRSWRLTRGHALKLLGFILLALVAAGLLLFAVTAVLSILATLIEGGAPAPGSLGALLLIIAQALITALFTVHFQAMTARIYAQLAGDGITGT